MKFSLCSAGGMIDPAGFVAYQTPSLVYARAGMFQNLISWLAALTLHVSQSHP